MRFAHRRLVFITVAVFASCLTFPTRTNAQSQGNNAVYNSNASCSSTTYCGFSGAFIDASTFFNSPPAKNFCSVLNWVLNPSNGIIPPTGAVIDARGLPGTGTSMMCTASPWAGITGPKPSTILLPAGTILIPKSWILPTNTHLIGEGDNPSASSLTAGTTIQACNSQKNSCSFSDSAMIQFGSSSAPGDFRGEDHPRRSGTVDQWHRECKFRVPDLCGPHYAVPDSRRRTPASEQRQLFRPIYEHYVRHRRLRRALSDHLRANSQRNGRNPRHS